jgi:membrane associated rhomboid family serine protease
MSFSPSERFTHLVDLDHPGVVPLVEAALRRAGIPYDCGLQSVPTPRVVLSVPSSRLEEARLAIVRELSQDDPPRRTLGAATESVRLDEDAEIEEENAEIEEEDAVFPAGPVTAAVSLFLVHLALVLFVVGRDPSAQRLASLGGLVTGRTLEEPYRLVTSLFLHADPSHAFWNGVSLLAFAVPLIVRGGVLRISLVYLASGIAGCLASLATTASGAVTIGSSGAVAGLFGAWVASALVRARSDGFTRRARIRAIGIALLVLPSLLTPTTRDGDTISVAAHVGGLLTGLVLGWVGSRGTGLSGRPSPLRTR